SLGTHALPYPTTRDTGPASLIKSVIHLRHCHPFLEVSFIYGTFNENADFAFRYRKVACGVTTVFVENQNNPRGLSISLRNQHHAQFDRTQGSPGRGGGGGAAAGSHRVERSNRRQYRRTGRDGSCGLDRKSTRLNSSHSQISYAVFCLKKKKKKNTDNNVL